MPTRRGGLRSESDGKRLEVPFSKAKTFAARSISVYGPTNWNSLPKELQDCTEHQQFKSGVKTFLFKENLFVKRFRNSCNLYINALYKYNNLI